MLVRIQNRGNRHYGHYGIVYKTVPHHGHRIVLLRDEKSHLCLKNGFAKTSELEMIPDEEERDILISYTPTFCDTNVSTHVSNLASLVEDGRKYRAIKKLLED